MEIVIPYNMRLNYLKITLATLKEALRTTSEEFSVKLYNTNQDGMGNDLEIFKEFDNLEVKTNIKSNVGYEILKHGNLLSDIDDFMPKIINDAINNTDREFMLLLDADTVLHPLALEKAVGLCKRFPDLAAGTIFNSMISEFSDFVDDEYGRKKLIAGFGLIIKKDVWLDFCKTNAPIWERDYLMYVHDRSEYNTYCTRHSYLEHIGFSGLHKTAEESGHPLSIDRALNFFD